MTLFVDPKRRLPGALRSHTRGTRTLGDEPEAIIRNRLLDDVGSDARPLVNLLLEAYARGIPQTLPAGPLAHDVWERHCARVVMAWVADRFIDAEVARWAVETWAFAIGALDTPLEAPQHAPVDVSATERNIALRLAQRATAPLPASPPVRALRSSGGTSPAGRVLGASPPSAVGSQKRAVPTPARMVRSGAGYPSGYRATVAHHSRGPYGWPARVGETVGKVLLACLTASVLLLLIRTMLHEPSRRRMTVQPVPTAAQSPGASPSRGVSGPENGRPVVEPNDSAPQSTSSPAERGVPQSSAGVAAPGVPAITRNALPIRDQDAARISRVNPATRPVPRGTSTPARAGAPGWDQLRLLSGRTLLGRVDVIRTASVVFYDAQTGLRYEFAKDDILEIITEFGNLVRFRQAGSVTSRVSRDQRQVSVSGRYTVRYGAARVNGAPVCRDLWRGPSGSDLASVRHRAGDDTLSISFDGGDTFPSVLDADGLFASTFRILPGQAELATALTTRLNGRFNPDGSLTLQVNVIGYRRVQGTSGVACHVIVDATGEKLAPPQQPTR